MFKRQVLIRMYGFIKENSKLKRQKVKIESQNKGHKLEILLDPENFMQNLFCHPEIVEGYKVY